MLIERATSLEQYDLTSLVDESVSEGHKFVKKLLDEYEDGSNRFNRLGESLFVAKINGEVIGIGGLNIDPYLELNDVGRVRHLYVLPRYRRSGAGKKLLGEIIKEAKKYFRTLTLYTENPIADHLYRSLGFSTAEEIHKASHVLNLVQTKNTVYIISGPAGVGKSTTSNQLVQTIARSAYISGDDISHIPVNGRGKPWLDRDTLDLTWRNIASLVQNLLDYQYDIVIDYVAFLEDVQWLAQQLKHREVKMVYVVLLVNRETIIYRDQLRPKENQMGDRSPILLEEFESSTKLQKENKLYTTNYSEEQLPEIIKEITTNDKYILSQIE